MNFSRRIFRLIEIKILTLNRTDLLIYETKHHHTQIKDTVIENTKFIFCNIDFHI